MTTIIKSAFASALTILLWSNSVNAQQTYQTKAGSIGIVGVYEDTKIIANSNQLFALINYEIAEIELMVDLATLHTTDSSIVKLINPSIGPVMLKGKLNIPYVNTLSHPDYKLSFEAELHLNGIVKSMYVTGELKHIASNGFVSCLLTLTFKVSLGDFEIAVPQGWNNEITIQVSQAVLNKTN